MSSCPNCGTKIPPAPRGIQTHPATRRPGGRQVSYQRGVRVLAHWLIDEGLMDGKRAHRTAARVLLRALPTKQRLPRQASQIREAA